MNANDVMGKCLIAKQTVNVRSNASLTSSVIGQVSVNQVIGPVYSWVEKDGYVWWMVDYSIPGQSPGAYWVAQLPGAWKLTECSGARLDGSTFESNKEDKDVNILETGLKFFQWAIIAVVGILIFKK